jgi:hypothetical protein
LLARGCAKVMPPFFFNQTIITVVMKCTYIMGTFFRKMRLFFQKASLSTLPPPPPLCEILYASHVKLFAETLEFLLLAMFQLTIHKIVSLPLEVGVC